MSAPDRVDLDELRRLEGAATEAVADLIDSVDEPVVWHDGMPLVASLDMARTILDSGWLADREATAEKRGAERVANAFVAWAIKNEIAEPPLDWAWFGEIVRQYSPLHEHYRADQEAQR